MEARIRGQPLQQNGVEDEEVISMNPSLESPPPSSPTRGKKTSLGNPSPSKTNESSTSGGEDDDDDDDDVGTEMATMKQQQQS